MTRKPIILEGEPFDWAAGNEAASNVIDDDGEINWGNAFAADPGVVSCPRCCTYHWAEGTKQRCTECGFEYPTNWRHWFTSGQSASNVHRPHAAPSAPARPDCPYYMHGWRNPGITWQLADAIPWPVVLAEFEPWRPTPAEAAAIAAEAARGDCKHYRGTIHDTCAAGVDYRALVGGPDNGWCSRLPCLASIRQGANGPTAPCDRFAAPTAAEVAEDRARTDEMIARYEALVPIRSRIKVENKGRAASGVAECPVCGGRLRWSHAAYNGHVHLQCETDNCVWIIE